jgi:hypothetical protein
MARVKIPSEMRRSQLISPFGVGSLYNREDGSSVIICGLDFWLEGLDADQLHKLEIRDERLQNQLRVSKLYRPPATVEDLDDYQNEKTKFVPVLRFPTWYVCSFCGKLERKKLYQNSKVECSSEHKGGFKAQMYQVSYVAMCKDGHIDDFPWNEFVHRDIAPNCKGDLRFREALSGDMQNVVVTCKECRSSRKISDVMSNVQYVPGRSNLTKILDESDRDFLCGGTKPWLGSLNRESNECLNDLYPTFRGAGNVYFPYNESALLIPEGTERSAALVTRLSSPKFIFQRNKSKTNLEGATSEIITMVELESMEFGLPNWISVESYSPKEIEIALQKIVELQEKNQKSLNEIEEISGVERVAFRFQEYRRLREPSNDNVLCVIDPIGKYERVVEDYFEQVKLITSLTETRAFLGFARLSTDEKRKGRELRKLLRASEVAIGSPQDWLPAIQVRGEGIFLQLNREKLHDWENSLSVTNRWSHFGHSDFLVNSGFEITPKFVLIHTLSHLVLKELTYFCGYTQASLRERIYCSSNTDEMAGFLIYTASGDSEGTLGGLVRMGKPGFLDEIVEKALIKSSWCSNDPVCMENISIGGDETTLASCYACTLIPETSCEAFNKYLDRAFVTGNPGTPKLGFFEDFSEKQ